MPDHLRRRQARPEQRKKGKERGKGKRFWGGGGGKERRVSGTRSIEARAAMFCCLRLNDCVSRGKIREGGKGALPRKGGGRGRRRKCAGTDMLLLSPFLIQYDFS